MGYPISLEKDTPASANILGRSGYSHSLGWQDIWKNVQNETTNSFSVGNTKISILTN